MINISRDNNLLSVDQHISGFRLEPIVNLFSGHIISHEVLSQLAAPSRDSEVFFANLSAADSVALFCRQANLLKSRQASGSFFLNLPLMALIDERLFARLLDVCESWITIEIQDAPLFDTCSRRHQLCLRERIKLLQQQRISVWLDDLTEGCIESFHRYAIDVGGVKIDKQAFWTLGKNPRALQRLVARCADISPHIIIEGIEDTHHLELARQSGARLGQGYLWPHKRWLLSDTLSL
ncbi:EAL domain-containing protein [Enterobacter sp. Cy-643]|uniref:EAL domain-containing protein n=1 Tax=Enterobacter sp. Cy-643 TaxID=2608346 RepID=UPI00141FB70A|nr:EAL domain-containing protein [Enterobacter sp. Cy-643]NIF34329.1 EAL domain-containing protein [Enterobacter sp. Cy-643]